LTIEAQWAVKITSYEEIAERRERAGPFGRLMRNAKSGKVALFVQDHPGWTKTVTPFPSGRCSGRDARA
jgi:hypothetical protein